MLMTEEQEQRIYTCAVGAADHNSISAKFKQNNIVDDAVKLESESENIRWIVLATVHKSQEMLY